METDKGKTIINIYDKDGKPTVVRKLNGRSCRFVCLKLQGIDNFLGGNDDFLLP